MRVKKTNTGTTYVYKSKSTDTGNAALEREISATRLRYRSSAKYLEYNYWRYMDAKKHWDAEYSKCSHIIGFMNCDKDTREIVNNNILAYIYDIPESLDTFKLRFREGFEVYAVPDNSPYFFKLVGSFILNNAGDLCLRVCKNYISLVSSRKSFENTNDYKLDDTDYKKFYDSLKSLI